MELRRRIKLVCALLTLARRSGAVLIVIIRKSAPRRLIQAGRLPVYLEAARNPFEILSVVLMHCFDETYLRDQIRERDAGSADASRPFRFDDHSTGYL